MTGAVAVCMLLVACDTGDGKTLRDPVGTLPPPTTTIADLGGGDLGDLGGGDLGGGDLGAGDPLPAEELDFQLLAPWLDGAAIDARHTCDDEDVSPALSWVAPPASAVQLAIAVVDESITNGPPFIHWVIAGIDPGDRSILESGVPVGAVQGLNFFGTVGWGGPCPPPGDEAHSYRFTLYALNQQVELADGTAATDLLEFIELVAIASTDVVGTYRR